MFAESLVSALIPGCPLPFQCLSVPISFHMCVPYIQATLCVNACAADVSRVPKAFDGFIAESALPVLGAFSDQAPEAHPAMWDMVLSYARAFPASWHAVNPRKGVLPRIYSFLRCGRLASLLALHASLASVLSAEQAAEVSAAVSVLWCHPTGTSDGDTWRTPCADEFMQTGFPGCDWKQKPELTH